MKRFTLFLLVAFIISGCASSSKLMQSGNYDAAIYKSLRKLRGKSPKDKEILVLEQAYQKANSRDKEQIEFLKKEGQPDNWDRIFSIYSNMRQRQEMVKPLLPLHIKNQGRDANFLILNYDEELIQAKKNAAEFLYAHAVSLLNTNSKTEARKAHGELLRVKSLYPNFKDIDSQLGKARSMGTSYVLLKMQNTTGVPLPPWFETDLTKISLSELDMDWLVYHTNAIKDLKYDYTILVNMKNISVSPEAVKEIDYVESKEVPDGFQYILDEKGNVKKDEKGNDLKLPKTKIVSCNVSENYQNKKAIIAGTLDYINNNNGQLLKTDPIASENFFEYRSATAVGDVTILKPETKEKLGRKPVPFPSNFDMLLQAGQTLKGMVKNIIWANKAILY